MNKFTNISGQTTDINTKVLEVEEAKRKMGTTNYSPQSMGMTGLTNTTSQGYTGNTTNYTNLSSLSNVPDLNNSMSVDYTEIKKAKQKMNQGSSINQTY